MLIRLMIAFLLFRLSIFTYRITYIESYRYSMNGEHQHTSDRLHRFGFNKK